MSLEESFLQMQASLLAGRDGGDAVRRAAVLAERVLKQKLGRAPKDRAGLGEMIGAAHRSAELKAELGAALIKQLNWLNELRKRSVHDKGGGLVEVSVDEGQRAVDVVSQLMESAGLLSAEDILQLAREAEWQASSGPSDAVLTLDRVSQRDHFEGLISRPRRLIVLVVHGEAGQGQEHFARVMNWRLQASPTGRWVEYSVEWPAPSSSLGVRLGFLLESVVDALGLPLEFPVDCDPAVEAADRSGASGPWSEALEPVFQHLEKMRNRLYVRHSIGLLCDVDAPLIERYLTLFWRPASARSRERALVTFEVTRAETAGLPLLARSWRLGRRERRVSEQIIETLDNMSMPKECRSQALDELTSISEEDLVRWLRNERGMGRTQAEELAREMIAATRGGRFELVARRVAALMRDTRTARR